MANSFINKVFLAGRVGKDPTTTLSSNGKTTICRFSIAVIKPGKENISWFNVVCFNELAKYMIQNVKKGLEIFLEGSLDTYSRTSETGKTFTTTSIIANKITLLSSTNVKQESEKESINFNNELQEIGGII